MKGNDPVEWKTAGVRLSVVREGGVKCGTEGVALGRSTDSSSLVRALKAERRCSIRWVCSQESAEALFQLF